MFLWRFVQRKGGSANHARQRAAMVRFLTHLAYSLRYSWRSPHKPLPSQEALVLSTGLRPQSLQPILPLRVNRRRRGPLPSAVSETQIIPLKGRKISGDQAEFWPLRLFVFELRCCRDAA